VIWVGAADKAANLMRCKSSVVNCPYGRLAGPMHAKVTTRVLLGCECHGCHVASATAVGATWVAQQTRGPEREGMIAVAKAPAALKSLSGQKRVADPSLRGEGRRCRGRNGQVHPAYRRDRDPGTQGKIRGITSGRCAFQQGLAATCKDPLPRPRLKAVGGARTGASP
jgi:hypothetical protein